MNPTRIATRLMNVRVPLSRCATAVVAGLVLASFAAPVAAAVYKWVDPQGRIHYSDRPPPPEGKLLSIDTSATVAPRTSASSTVPQSRPALPSAPPPGTPSTPEAASRLKQQVNNDVANVRADQCKQATDRYQNYLKFRRLYKEGPNGERIYLSDAELETERVNAKRDVDELCNGGG